MDTEFNRNRKGNSFTKPLLKFTTSYG